jgi:putative addiction module component (TIGR02574 family)
MDSTLLEQARKLSTDEQLALIEALWDDLATRAGVPLPTAAQIEELDRRVAEDDAHPDDVVPWSDVEAQALARIRR